jgi:hypothetical protein
MKYTAEISRTNPSCFLFLIDQSASMADPIGTGESGAKKSVAADAINRLLSNLCIKCAKEEGVRDYFHVGVIGYGGTVAGPAFGGGLAGRDVVPLSEIAIGPIRVDNRTKQVSDGAGGLVDQTVKFPVWLEPQASGGTPMCQALDYARGLVQRWVADHPACAPPVVINVTDGESTDGNPGSAAGAVRAVASSDGEVLLFNLHLSSNRATAVEYPADDAGLADQYARLLFSMSSPLPPHLTAALRQERYTIGEGARGFVFNAELVATIKFLDIGTRPSNLR